jgi:hypothetical protein
MSGQEFIARLACAARQQRGRLRRAQSERNIGDER